MTIELLISVLLLVWVLMVIIQSFVHFHLIEVYKQKPFYLLWNIIRGMFAIAHGVTFDVQNMGEYWPVLSFQLLTHFVIFSPALNMLRKPLSPHVNFWYLGADSGWLDELLGKLNMTLYKLVYYTACGLIPVSIWWVFRTFLG